ncbi:MAG TPA: asparagine synthase (glutamine-hydrolyzing) [Acidobacteriota bacterium]|jgi:asparagine synthase (glutamine-hydrolysing)
MCGIAGFTGRCDAQLLTNLQRALHHRGPDESGVLCSDQIALSSNRLAIIDLATGRQPIFNEDRSCAIVFNGEIYNYRELRKDLEARHQFSSHSDTEVILHLYEEEGTDAPRRLRGDFAFCIWDSRSRSCFLSRDHIGVKPLYYALTPERELVFSSEMKALLGHPRLRCELDLEAVLEYFSYLYISAPRTLCRGIYKLRAGESLLWKEGTLRTWQYWHVPHRTGDTSAAEFRAGSAELLRNAVARRLIADVPVGAFLSGGLDSSLIVALAAEQAEGLKTFSIGYGEADFDELRFARQVSRIFRTEHHELILKPDIESLIEQVIAAMDEPIADSSAIPTFLVARETARHVKAVMSGVGGDELFSGYPRYLGAKLSERIPRVLAAPVARAAAAFRSEPTGRDLSGWINRFGKGLLLDPQRRYALWTSFLEQENRDVVSAPPPEPLYFQTELSGLFEQSRDAYIDAILRVDLNRYLPSDLLKFGDNMTMANSLELRVPFCDVDLVEHVARTPARVRFPGWTLKPVLKSIAESHLPRDLIYRKKQGFMVPIGKWFRCELKSYLDSALRAEKLPSFLAPAVVSRIVQEHVCARRNHTHLLWALIVLTRWLELNPVEHTVEAGSQGVT